MDLLKYHTYFRVDNTRLPTWSINGHKRPKGKNDRIIINIPDHLLSRVHHTKLTIPGCRTDKRTNKIEYIILHHDNPKDITIDTFLC